MKQGFIRIIGGKWRGRKLKVPDVSGLRPTPDRVRETVFNWLAPVVVGSKCLDLFAGSGALGFEALSRGALFVEMVDESAEVIKVLEEQKAKLGAENLKVEQREVPRQLSRGLHQFDIVFLDPPYAANLLLDCCRYLELNHFLANTCYIYLESHAELHENDLPKTWRIIKSKHTGQVFYHLALRQV